MIILIAITALGRQSMIAEIQHRQHIASQFPGLYSKTGRAKASSTQSSNANSFQEVNLEVENNIATISLVNCDYTGNNALRLKKELEATYNDLKDNHNPITISISLSNVETIDSSLTKDLLRFSDLLQFEKLIIQDVSYEVATSLSLQQFIDNNSGEVIVLTR